MYYETNTGNNYLNRKTGGVPRKDNKDITQNGKMKYLQSRKKDINRRENNRRRKKVDKRTLLSHEKKGMYY